MVLTSSDFGLGQVGIAMVLAFLTLTRVGATFFSSDPTRSFDGLNILLIGQFAWYLAEPIFDELSWYRYPIWRTEYMLLGFWAVAMTSWMTTLAYLYLPIGAWITRGGESLVTSLEHASLRMLVITSAISLLPIMVGAAFNPGQIVSDLTAILARSETPDSLYRSHLGTAESIIIVASTVTIVATMVAGVLLLKSKSRTTRYVALSIGLFFFAYRFALGRRSLMWLHLLPLLAPYVMLRGPRGQRFVRLLAIVLLPAMLFINQFLLHRRTQQQEVRTAASMAMKDEGYQGHNMFSPVVYLANYVPEHIPYQYGSSTFGILAAFPIPRAILPNKPVGLGIVFMKREFGATDVASSSFGHIGEFISDFGVLFGSVVAGVVYGWLGRLSMIFASRTRRAALVIYAPFAGAIFFAMRGVGMFQTVIVALVFLMLGTFAMPILSRYRVSLAKVAPH
ncbi:MAG: O-antigen polymerase [Polyangiaceae bacterium]